MLHRPIARSVIVIRHQPAFQRDQAEEPATAGKTTMKHAKEILAAAGLSVVIGMTGTAKADTTLYTSAIHTGVIACNAINVSKKTLNITISIFDGTMTSPPTTTKPTLLGGPTLIQTPPGMEATVDFGSPTESHEGYCVFQVSGTGNPDDVRAIQNAVLAGTRSVDDGKTFFPIFIHRVLEAH
jgi:subtilase family serine protease